MTVSFSESPTPLHRRNEASAVFGVANVGAGSAIGAKRSSLAGELPDQDNDELMSNAPNCLRPPAQLQLGGNADDCLGVLELAANWEEKLYGVEGRKPLMSFSGLSLIACARMFQRFPPRPLQYRARIFGFQSLPSPLPVVCPQFFLPASKCSYCHDLRTA